jgi:hypothetical protein
LTPWRAPAAFPGFFESFRLILRAEEDIEIGSEG